MAKLDERAKAELYKINQEKFFISAIIIAVFLIVKINMQVGVLSMLGEITAAAVIFIYLAPYFVIRYKYKTIDEMVKSKLYKLSSTFFMLELSLILISAAIIQFISFLYESNELLKTATKCSYDFLGLLSVITVLYGIIRSHNEKFASQSAAELSLPEYKKTLLLRAIITSAIMVTVIFISTIICIYIQAKTPFLKSDAWSQAFVWLAVGILVCFLGIMFCWSMYFYYLGIRKKLEKKIEPKSTDEI